MEILSTETGWHLELAGSNHASPASDLHYLITSSVIVDGDNSIAFCGTIRAFNSRSEVALVSRSRQEPDRNGPLV